MELEYLTRRRADELARAAAATNGPARLAHKGLADVYAARIKEQARRISAPQH